MLKNIKQTMPNIYILIVALSVSLWFEGSVKIIRILIPGNNMQTALLMCSISLAVFMMDDGKLGELYSYEPNNDKLLRHAPSAVASMRKK